MRLTKNTLFDISKHTNKTVKIADYLSKAGHPLLFNKMAMVNEQSSEIEFIEAFNKDIADTTKKLHDVHQLLSTVDDNGNVIHLKGERSLKAIFGESYDQDNQTILLPFGKMHLKRDFSRDSVKNQIVEKYLGLSEEEYNVLFKARAKIFKHSKDQLYNDEDKIEFLSTIVDREKYQNAVDSISEMSDKYTTFRESLTLEEKSLVDDKITFQRSMVDNITKGSTYITEKDGVVQYSNGHKKQQALLDQIIVELKENKSIDSVEIDPDTSLEAFLALMKQIKGVKFNLSEAVCLKSRKLGNYNANGLFYPKENIVALNVETPSAAIHEFVHAVDLKNSNIRYSSKRHSFAAKMREHLDLSGMNLKQKTYYNSTAEIIARAGEVAYVLEHYDFDPNRESLKDFSDRVSVLQDSTNPYDLNLVKNIDTYLKNSDIYFNLLEMPNEDLMLMKDYFKTHFRIQQELEILPLKNVPVPDHVEHKVIGTRERYVATSIGLINSENIGNVLEYNNKNKIINPERLIKEIMYNPLRLNRTRKNLSNGDVMVQQSIIKKMCDWAFENDDFYLMSRIAETRVHVDANIDLEPYFLMEGLKNKKGVFKANYMDGVPEYLEKVKPLVEEYIPLTYKDRERQAELIKENNELSEKTITKPNLLLEDILKAAPDMKKIDEIRSAAREYEDGKKNKLNYGTGINGFYRHVDSMLMNTYNKDGDKIFNYFKKGDIFPIAIATQPNKLGYNSTIDRNIQRYHNEQRIISGSNDTTAIKNYNTSEVFVKLVDVTYGFDNILNKRDRLELITNPDFAKNSKGYPTNSLRIEQKLENKHIMEMIEKTNRVISVDNSVLEPIMKESVKSISNDYIQKKSKGLDNYEKVQADILEYENTFNPKEDVEIIKMDTPENNIEKPEVKVEIDNKKSILESINPNDTSPIDPNEPIEDKKRGKKKRLDPNQRRLF